jgi:hypothetical protein
MCAEQTQAFPHPSAGLFQYRYRDHEEQQAAIESYLTWRNHARDVSLTAWKQYKRENAKAA